MAPSLRQRGQSSYQSQKKDQIKKPKRPLGNNSNNKKEEAGGGSGVGVAYPSADTAFKALLSARFCAAIWSHVTDCDETFNYWEPSHYLLFGKGFQTWEYSPEFALRSYAYILVHVLPAWIYHNLLQPNRLLVFYFSRCLLGLLSALCEVYFYKSVCREFGIHVGRIMLVIQLFSAGMFISSTAFLPSSFSMYMTLLSLGAWYRRRYELAIFTTALSTFLSWPFAALIGLPIAIDMLFRRGEWLKFIQWSVISAVAILLPMLRIDSLYYGRLVVAPMNIVMYNVFTSHGPDLYGTESWTYYLYNGLLNFNFAFLAALLTPVALVLVQLLIPLRIRHAVCIPYWLSLAPLYIWLAVFWIQPHKEERFLFPVYPLVCLCGAITLDAGQKLWFRMVVRSGVHYLQHTTLVIIPALVVVCLLGLMRIVVLYKGYHAPMDIFMELNKLAAEDVISEDQPLNICIGKEWHRFPSSFFLPSDNWNLRFLKSEFKGQLPQPYSLLDNATMVLPANMNDMNKEEPSRYVNESICHFLVDLDRGPNSGTELEPNYSEDTSKWTIVKSVPFMDATKTNRWLRLFYVPFVWESNCVFNSYNLLKAVKSPPNNHHFVTSSL
ncbi:alpha-1,2-mannosyltransferase ALG9 [Nilaparvata lugens]|uniref:alpha-1,2-mannosyltransferase ALG9 n=1 Tax=Nilaparvata lugens TaxID=108931 RepID=UPI00193D39FA|nr:alpha-1,2-mannosyltransferase ALG9 [Nilaparvata lugens]